MIGIPLGSMVGQRGIGGGRHLDTEQGLLVGRDGTHATGWMLWGEIATGTAQAQPAFETATADLEGADGVRTGHAGIECVQDAHTEGG